MDDIECKRCLCHFKLGRRILFSSARQRSPTTTIIVLGRGLYWLLSSWLINQINQIIIIGHVMINVEAEAKGIALYVLCCNIYIYTYNVELYLLEISV